MSAFAGEADIIKQMQTDDIHLIQEFAATGSEEAFSTVVRRHINLVYSAALRRLGNPHEAEEVTQVVFIILAQKAGSLRQGIVVSGWLYQTAMLASANFQRSKMRRQRRDQEAYMNYSEESKSEPSWQQLSPLLEDAMARLGSKERDAILLRFFEDRTISEVAAALGMSEAAAQKRVNRATDKLRLFFSRRGVQVSPHGLLSSIGTHALQIAPAGLISIVQTVASTKGAAVGSSTLAVLKATMKTMAWTKINIALAVGAAAILTLGTAAVAVNELSAPSVEQIFTHINENKYLEKAPPVVVLRPGRYPKLGMQINGMHGPPFSAVSARFAGVGFPLKWVVSVAYGIGPERMILPSNWPAGPFDYLSAVPEDAREALQKEIERQFGLVAHTEIITTNVLILRVSNPSVVGLKTNHSHSDDAGISIGNGEMRLENFAMSGIVGVVPEKIPGLTETRTNIDNSVVNALGGYYFNMPVIDETGLKDSYDIDLHWDGSLKGENELKAIRNALSEQLGLELDATNMPVEMLIVEYADGHEAGPLLPRTVWKFAGFDTPQAALQSALAAMNRGNVPNFLDCLTPDFRQHFKVSSATAGENRHKAAEIVAYQIISEELVSDDETVLYIRSARLGNGQVIMKKIKSQWKMDEEPHG
jgi:uncharacterized protein (TIGR03435 family)